ncbi:MAG: TlpA family protein disulfide reductase [Gemmatimonadetes bacterium]|nr:TlpA family protein disulfide reductase [Gemmatimonadota bacterium]
MSKKRPWITYAIAATMAGLVVLMAWLNRDRLNPVVPGRPAPGFSATDLSGSVRTLDDFEGTVLLVNIWATWCSPCREEMPSMERLYQSIDDPGFEILAISVDAPLGESDAFGRPGGDLQAYSESLGLSFPVLHDPSGRVQQSFQTTGVPESFVIDRTGVIVKKIAGSTAWDAEQNVQLIQRLLGG